MTSDRVEIKINLSAIGRNYDRLKKLHGGKGMAVIKADAYGLGANAVAAYLENKVDYFGVATVEEGVSLRKAGIKKPVLILGYVPESGYSDLIFYDLETTLYDYESAKKISQFSNERETGCHIALDTGMNRLGFKPSQKDELKKTLELNGLKLRGVFTHYASSDAVKEQQRIFEEILSDFGFEDENILVHADNTDAVLSGYRTGNMFRTGIGLYGGVHSGTSLENVLTFDAAIVQVKEASVGERIGYSGTYVCAEKQKYVVISCGYGDGYPVRLSNKGYVLINDCRCPILGRVCMDYIMAGIPDGMLIQPGDRAILSGEGIPAEDLSDNSEAAFYEFLCNLGLRAKKIYF